MAVLGSGSKTKLNIFFFFCKYFITILLLSQFIALLPTMTIHNLYIFDRNGTCLHYSEWTRKKQSGLTQDEEFKLMYGMLFSIKSFINRIAPTDLKEGFTNFRTNNYKLHFYETPSGLKFVMNTDLSVGNIHDKLHQMYSTIYVEYVVKNPLCPLDQPITSELFQNKLDEYVRALPFFTGKVS